MKPTIFDRMCILFTNPWVWLTSFLLIAIMFKFWGCIFLLVLFRIIDKRVNDLKS